MEATQGLGGGPGKVGRRATDNKGGATTAAQPAATASVEQTAVPLGGVDIAAGGVDQSLRETLLRSKHCHNELWSANE